MHFHTKFNKIQKKAQLYILLSIAYKSQIIPTMTYNSNQHAFAVGIMQISLELSDSAFFSIYYDQHLNGLQDRSMFPKITANNQLFRSVKLCFKNKYIAFQIIIFLFNCNTFKSMLLIIMLSVIIKRGTTQNFNISLTDPFLLHEKGIGIKTMGKNFQGDFLLSFQNGQVRKYTSDLSSFVSINVSQVVQRFQSTQVKLYTTLLNGSFLDVSDRKLIFTLNGFKTINAYNYYSYSWEQGYAVNETIMEQFSFPINAFNKSNNFFILACNSSIIIAYQGVKQHYAYSNLFGGDICTAAKNSEQQISSNRSQLIAKISLFIAVAKQVYKLTATVKFTFNHSSSHFDLTQTLFTYIPIYLSLNPVTNLFVSNGLLMVQSDNLGLKLNAFFNLNTSLLGVAVGIPQDQTLAFFNIYNAFYILQKTSLVKLLYISLTNTVSVSAVMANLPSNNFGLVFNFPINAFFILGRPFLYRAGACKGQSYFQGSSCVSYSCFSANCVSCPIYPTVCSKTSQNAFSNSTSNTNNSNQTYNENTNNSTPENATQQSNNDQITYNFQSNSFQSLMFEYMVYVFKMLMSIPGGRRLLPPIFYYFGVFDDLFFYQFHDRIYGQGMNHVFDSLNQIQRQKWRIVDSEMILVFANVNIENFENTTDYQKDYNYFYFQDNNADMSEGVWRNLRNFFIVGIPVIFLSFILGRIVFNYLVQYSISKVFRKFAFLWYLALLIFDGNVEQFTFFQCMDWKNGFSFNFQTKIMKVQAILFGFSIILASSSLYFLSCAFNKKLRSYFMDNSKDTFQGQLNITIQFGFKNICFGFMHSFLRGFGYKKMVSVLIASQIIFTALFIYFLIRKAYKNILKVWIYILLNFIKIILILTLAIDYKNINQTVMQTVQIRSFIILIIIFLGGLLLDSFFYLIQVYYIVKGIFQKKKNISDEANKKMRAYRTKLIVISQLSSMYAHKTLKPVNSKRNRVNISDQTLIESKKSQVPEATIKQKRPSRFSDSHQKHMKDKTNK